MDDYQSDPLYTPFANVAPSVLTPPTFSFGSRNVTSGDSRSVIAIKGQSWFLGNGQLLTIPTVASSFYVCGNQTFPVNVTYGCTDAGTTSDPVRAIANRTIWTGITTYTELCDPAGTDCIVEEFCGVPPCVLDETWQELNSTDQLDIGLYENVW